MDYVEAFQNLKTNNKYSRKSPHKAVLLLAIIDMFESCELTDNVIKYDDALKSAFVKMWNKVLPNEATFHSEAYLPFWFMQSEGFWHIVPLRGKEDILTVLRDSHVKPSESKLRDCVNYAELDEDLYFLMTLQSGRSSLKRALLETYTTLSTRMIDRLSESSDNFTDSSEEALNEYESIISSAEVNQSSKKRKIDNELEDRFSKLKEDIQYVLNIEYFTFLKKNFKERELFKEICPTVYDLYDKIVYNPIKQGDFSPSISFCYENFLADLKITLMSEDGSYELIDKINEAINYLHSLENKKQEYSFENKDKIDEDILSTEITMSTGTPGNLPPLEPSCESRKGKPWTKEEENRITKYFKEQYSFEEIAKSIGRSVTSIKTRLASLGLIDYVYGEENENCSNNTLIIPQPNIFTVCNTENSGSIYDENHNCIYTVNGQLKIFNGKPYRFNYKEMCVTVKDIVWKKNRWDKGNKKIVAYEGSNLFSVLNKYAYIEHIEDLAEFENWEDNRIKVDGIWYDYKGYILADEQINDVQYNLNEKDEIKSDANGKKLGLQLNEIYNSFNSTYDYLWLLAIIDLVNYDPTQNYDYDNIACMMIANAWELRSSSPNNYNIPSSLIDCIQYLLEETKRSYLEDLSINSSKIEVYERIVDFPISGVFEDTIEELVNKTPINVLKLWISGITEESIMNQASCYSGGCMYAINKRKYDSYIEINPQWLNIITNSYNELSETVRNAMIAFCGYENLKSKANNIGLELDKIHAPIVVEYLHVFNDSIIKIHQNESIDCIVSSLTTNLSKDIQLDNVKEKKYKDLLFSLFEQVKLDKANSYKGINDLILRYAILFAYM